MYLSKLRLHGFKSFALPTELRFDPGITAIVGPNGCGKSNVVDAIRWVIGEQRARILRSAKMDSVIFNGSAKRRPLAMAEVELTIENTHGTLPVEYSEVTLGRRLYRSGDSEYLLNGVACRLRDVTDLFMDTGMGAGAYSVIELKMIEEILSDNAQDRRHLFEEAAGITKYKQRRAQALRKLDGTQADLARLRDVRDEIEKRVRSLKRQAATAARYNTHQDRVCALEAVLAQREYDRLVWQEEELGAKIRRLKDTLSGFAARIGVEEAERQALRKQHVDHEGHLTASRQQLSRHLNTVRDLEADLRLEQERLQTAGRDRERTGKEVEDTRTRKEALESRRGELLVAISEAEPVLEEAQKRLHAARQARDRARNASEAQRQTLRSVRKREAEAGKQRADSLRQADQLANRMELLAREMTRLRELETALEASEADISAEDQAASQRLAAARTALSDAREHLAAVEAESDVVWRALEKTGNAIHDVERVHAAKVAERDLLQGLLASYEDFPNAVRFLSEKGASPLVTISDVLTCDEPYRAALDAALGSWGTCLVVQTDAEAQQAVALLREEDKGRALFLVMDRLTTAVPDVEACSRPGLLPLSDCVVASSSQYAPLGRVLLQHVCYVDTLEEAQSVLAKAPESPARFVTARGEWLDEQGFVYAGSDAIKESPGAERMARRKRLAATLDALIALESKQSALVEDRDQRIQALQAIPLDEARDAASRMMQAFVDAERVAERAADRHDDLRRQRSDVEAQLQATSAAMEVTEQSVDTPRLAVREAEQALESLQRLIVAAEQDLQAAEQESLAAQDRFNRAGIDASHARNRVEGLQRDVARLLEETADMERRMLRREGYLESLGETMRTARGRIEDLDTLLRTERSNRTALEDAVAADRTRLMQTRVDTERAENRLKKLRRLREETVQEEHAHAVQQASLQAQREQLTTSIQEKLNIEFGAERVPIEEDFDEDTAREELVALQDKMRQMGSVNALALEEFETESERLEFMTAQCADLEMAEGTLLETISEINATAAERFTETYTAIRANFRNLFEDLFGHDASADLDLAEPDQPLESPIHIMAKPRGKRPINIAQLSSGEKTLTAIALLFAIYLVKPSPFCFLDEVDAPLDDSNIDRFMRLIRRFSLDTQFILVTHNKRTMEMADRLYGITMQEQGLSRMVGVRFEEAMAYVG